MKGSRTFHEAQTKNSVELIFRDYGIDEAKIKLSNSKVSTNHLANFPFSDHSVDYSEHRILVVFVQRFYFL